MGLSGPSPSFIKLGAFLGKQALKGIKDNVQHYGKSELVEKLLKEKHCLTLLRKK